MPPDNGLSEYVWVEGNEFCCICSWWHMPPLRYDHEPMLCPRCLLDAPEIQKKHKRDPFVMPERIFDR
jgi:hypothetical protein